jgi:hypothetical protein
MIVQTIAPFACPLLISLATSGGGPPQVPFLALEGCPNEVGGPVRAMIEGTETVEMPCCCNTAAALTLAFGLAGSIAYSGLPNVLAQHTFV